MNKIAQISAKIGGGVALSLFSLANIAPADAATFDLTDTNTFPTSFSVTDGGVTATFSNPSPGGAVFNRTANGLQVYGRNAINGSLLIGGFDVVFDQDVVLNGYDVTSAQSLEGDETITATVGAQTSVEGPFTVGAKTFANQITVAAGQVVSFAISGGAIGSTDQERVDWNNLEVTPVPEPASLVGLLGVGALGFASRKRK